MQQQRMVLSGTWDGADYQRDPVPLPDTLVARLVSAVEPAPRKPIGPTWEVRRPAWEPGGHVDAHRAGVTGRTRADTCLANSSSSASCRSLRRSRLSCCARCLLSGMRLGSMARLKCSGLEGRALDPYYGFMELLRTCTWLPVGWRMQPGRDVQHKNSPGGSWMWMRPAMVQELKGIVV